MPSPSIHLRTPDATPGSFVKILWDFTRSTMGSTQPPQYELFKSRITPSTSEYWAAVHIPPVDSNQDPTEVSFVGKSMPPSIHLRTPDATPGSFVKILWDFTRSTMGSTQPPQYELFKSRITPSTSEYWAAVHIPPVDSNQDPTEVSFVGKSMPTPHMVIEAAAYEALAR